MTDTDGLTLEQVRAQWVESQRLLDEVRVRLDAVAGARASSDLAARSLASSDESLAALVTLHTEAVEALRSAQAAAVSALKLMVQAAADSQEGRLRELVQATADKTAIVADAQAGLVTGQAELSGAVGEVQAKLTAVALAQASLLTALDQTAEVSAQLAIVAAERDKARGDLDRVLASLSGRNRAKAEAVLRR